MISGNMIRQISKVKQIAHQTFPTFLRGEKSEALTEDLVIAEKRVDQLKQACQSTGKKIAGCLQGGGSDNASIEKRTKKMPELQLSQCMQQCGNSLGEGSILGDVLLECSNIQGQLGKELLNYELEAEKHVLQPIVNLLENDLPNINKLRKQLTKLTADMDAARSRYHTALRSANQSTGNSISAALAKADNLKEEQEEASTKADQCRDALAAEMFALISREPEFAQLFVQWYHLLADYHRAVLAELEAALPGLDSRINDFSQKPVFGASLEEHLRITDRQIALAIETCVCCLLQYGMEEEGLFRIAGSASKVKKLKSAFNCGILDMSEFTRDPHTVAGVLKSYLRELPEPLMTFALYEDWMKAARMTDQDARLQALWQVVNKLPEQNFSNLRYFIKFLARLATNSESNKMSPQNIAIVIAPNLIWPPNEDGSIPLGMNMTLANIHSSIVDSLVTYAEWFFPGEVEYAVMTPATPPADSPVDGHPVPVNGELDHETGMNSSSANSSPPSQSPKQSLRHCKKPAPPAPPTPQTAPREKDKPPTLERVSSFNADKSPIPFPTLDSLKVDKQDKPVSATVRNLTVPHERPEKPERPSILQRNRSHENFANMGQENRVAPVAVRGDRPERPERPVSYAASSLERKKLVDRPLPAPRNSKVVGPYEKPPLPPPPETSTNHHVRHLLISPGPVERPSVPPPEKPNRVEKVKTILENHSFHQELPDQKMDILSNMAMAERSLTLDEGSKLRENFITFADDSESSNEAAPGERQTNGSDSDKRPLLLELNSASSTHSPRIPLGVPNTGSASGSSMKQDRWNFLLGPNHEKPPERPPRMTAVMIPFDHEDNQEGETSLLDQSLPEESLKEFQHRESLSPFEAQDTLSEGSPPFPVLLSEVPVSISTTATLPQDKQYCTVIQVGNLNNGAAPTKLLPSQDVVKVRPPRPQPPPPPPPSRLRVNVHTEDTRL